MSFHSFLLFGRLSSCYEYLNEIVLPSYIKKYIINSSVYCKKYKMTFYNKYNDQVQTHFFYFILFDFSSILVMFYYKFFFYSKPSRMSIHIRSAHSNSTRWILIGCSTLAYWWFDIGSCDLNKFSVGFYTFCEYMMEKQNEQIMGYIGWLEETINWMKKRIQEHLHALAMTNTRWQFLHSTCMGSTLCIYI